MADWQAMKKMRKQTVALFGRLSQSAVAARETIHRTVWAPLIVAILLVVGVGTALVDRAPTESSRQAGLVLVGAGVLGAIVTWGFIIGESTKRKRDLQMQINAKNPLDSCDFTSARLQDSYLRNQQMNSIRLAHADLRKTDFTETVMADAVLTHTDTHSARFDNINEFDLHGFRADFRETQFTKSNLKKTHFEEADLRHAVFAHADLTDADMHKTNLRGADFNSTTVTTMRFDGTLYDSSTIWPTTIQKNFTRSARDLVEVGDRRIPLLRPQQQTNLVLDDAALFATLFVGGLALAISNNSSNNPTNVNDQPTQILGQQIERESVVVDNKKLAQITIDDNVNVPLSLDVWLPYQTSINITKNEQTVHVSVVRRVKTNKINYMVEIDNKILTLETTSKKDTNMICSNTNN